MANALNEPVPSRGRAIYFACIVAPIITAIFVALRAYSRFVVTRKNYAADCGFPGPFLYPIHSLPLPLPIPPTMAFGLLDRSANRLQGVVCDDSRLPALSICVGQTADRHQYLTLIWIVAFSATLAQAPVCSGLCNIMPDQSQAELM